YVTALCKVLILTDVEVFHSETTTAVEGQNVTLPCAIKSQSDLKIVDVEWNKKNENGDKTKLVLYHPLYGLNQFQPNVTIQIENNTANKSTGFSLHLTAVKKWQSGIYICSFSTFPLGSIMREMGLQISGKKQANTCIPYTPTHLKQTLQRQKSLPVVPSYLHSNHNPHPPSRVSVGLNYDEG
uniref:Ig-like domain-containing protein n=1 Tax=Monopterus albus TaxID=43700 RepID=A0A3Q3QS72_MONAL